jgi:RNAse (barnase) inhibitor barstar
MNEYNKFLNTKGCIFHVLDISDNNLLNFVRILNEKLRNKAYLAIIELDNIKNKRKLFKTFAEALHFPDYFGYNWDAFDECINDLSWIKADAYILILKNIKLLNIGYSDTKILLDTLKDSANEWMNGRTYNPSFPTPPTPFHIVFYDENKDISEQVKFLKSNNIEDIDVFKA